MILSAPIVRRSTKFCGCWTNLGRSSPWISTRSGTLPPASAVVSACAVSCAFPTSVSLIWMSGLFALYSAADPFASIPVNDQNSNDEPSDPPEEVPDDEPEQAAMLRAAVAANTTAETLRNFTATSFRLLWSGCEVFHLQSLLTSLLAA